MESNGVSDNLEKNTQEIYKLPYQIKYKENIIKYFKHNNTLYFKGKDIINILGCTNISLIVGNTISDTDKITVKKLLNENIDNDLRLFLQGQDGRIIYFSYAGTKNIINKKNNIEFNNWIEEIYSKLLEKSNNLNMLNFVYKFNTVYFTCFSIKDQVYFKAKEIAEFLDYEDTKDAISKHINEKNRFIYNNFKLRNIIKKEFKSSLMLSEEDNIDLINCPELRVLLDNNHPQTIYINESRLYELILNSKKPQAKDFRHWIVSDVLPSLRKTGKY